MSSRMESTVSSMSTEEPNSFIISILDVSESLRVSLSIVGKMYRITSLSMTVIEVREISGLRDDFWFGSNGMSFISGEAKIDEVIFEEMDCDRAICEGEGRVLEISLMVALVFFIG